MSDTQVSLMQPPEGYGDWLAALKKRIHTAQQKATLAVNRELVLLYWQIGRDILARQAEQGWGAKVIERLAHDLRNAFPEMKGFSRTNLLYMRSFAEAWPDEHIVQQAVGQLPWGHNLVLLGKLKTAEERLAYAQKTLEHGWSRNVLVMQIETRFIERQGNAITNFEQCLPRPESDLARESLKDPYRFDFLGLDDEAPEYQPTIGLLLCKSKNKVVAEYALGNKTQPMGIAEYKLRESLPESLETSLPSIEQIERELEGGEV
ncbi:MAG: PDDEXK nuclease domain-containing protein [Chlorobium phaeovibrioides]|nr:PDDEXK nuclease domain-containing protein [Chlorobium phaeovibrioides]